MTGWALTRTNIGNWRPQVLTDLATIIEHESNVTYGDQIAQMPKHFSDLNGAWAGVTFEAASSRVDQDYTQSLKVGQEVIDLVAVVREAGSRLFHEREALLGKATDAEQPVADLKGATLKVGDNWQISVTYPADMSAEDREKVLEFANGHQGLINSAWTSLRDASHEADRLMHNAAQQVRDAGSNFGDGIDAAVTPGTADNRPELTAQNGVDDGNAIADGTATPEELDRIADNLARTGLTPEQLTALANGDDATIPQSTMSYLRTFYDSAGKDGLLSLSEQLRANGSPEALALNKNLGNGLLTISQEHVVTRNGLGQVQGRGSFQNLPPDLQELVGTRPRTLSTLPDTNGPLPDDYKRTDQVDEYKRDMSRFAELLGDTDPNYVPGQQLGVELSRQAAHQGQLADSFDSFSNSYAVPEERIQDLLDVGTRSKEANLALLTGEAPEGVLGDNYKMENVVGPMLTREWEDDGASLSGMFRWIEGDATSPDVGTATDAGKAASALSGYLSQNHQSLMELDGPRTESLGVRNPEVVQGLSSALKSYIPELAGLPSDLRATEGFTPPDGNNEDRPNAASLFALMDTDKQAATEFNTQALLAANELQGRWLTSAIDNPDAPINQLAVTSGSIQALVDKGLLLEATDRTGDITKAAQEVFGDKSAIYDSGKALLSTGVKYIPVVGPILGPAVDFENTWLKNTTVGLYTAPEAAAENFDPNAQSQAARRCYQLAQVLEAREGTLSHDPRYNEYFDSDGRLKDYTQLVDGDRVIETTIYSDLYNVLNGYNDGVLKIPLLQLDDHLEVGQEKIG